MSALPDLVPPRATLPAAMPMATVVVLLSLLLGLQPVTTDLYLPALPAIGEGFGASMAQTQLTLSALLLAFGLSQLVWGPLSDRFGRRPVLLWGLGLYTVASFVIVFAPSIDWLILGRIAQGMALGAAVMGARAIVRDLFEPLAGAHAMSRALTGLGLIACLCAPLGGWLADQLGWRWALLATALSGASCWLLVQRQFQESLARLDAQALNPLRLWRRWMEIGSHSTFLGFTALSVATWGGLFSFLATSSFVFIQIHGFSRTRYGLVMLSMSLVYIVGTLICRRLLPRLGVQRSVRLAALLSLGAGLSMLALAYAGWHSPWALILPQYLFMLAHGVHQPCSQSGAVGPFPQSAGTASAMNGFAMTLASFAMGVWLGGHMDGSVFPLAHSLAFWGCCVFVAAWFMVRRP